MGTSEPARNRRRRPNRARKRKKRLDTWKVTQTLLTAFRILLWFWHH